MNRSEALQQLDATWDLIIIGGGATGLGTAVDAANRGYKTLLLEQADFCKGTSSKATKLVHGGVRYLEQGNIALVREASIERGLLYQNAPHLFKNLTFLIPNYSYYNNLLYTVGLKFYDILAGSLSLGKSKYVKTKTGLLQAKNVKTKDLKGFTQYHDGQFDDARLAINLAQTATNQGATLLNYMQVTQLLKKDNKISGLTATDILNGKEYKLQAKVVLNATGVWADEIIKMDVPKAVKTIQPSQGIHLVFNKEFYPNETALMIPKTTDGRVLFVIPWHDKVLVGTTDTKIESYEIEPLALENEIDFILLNCQHYLEIPPSRADVLSVFSGLRPLAASTNDKTKEISRSHKIMIAKSNLVTIIGGKWTTYRKMAEDVLDKTSKAGLLPAKKCKTQNLHIHGYKKEIDQNNPFYFYGSDLEKIKAIEQENVMNQEKIHPNYAFTSACVIFAVQNEMAFKVEDFLARRIRLLFLDAKAAVEAAPKVAQIMAQELNQDATWIANEVTAFALLAKKYELTL
ncbi:glycerol-3-phosphate dehydrogenase/oxidase [Flavobacterium agricola]|uniref:Glycerol-3-phosphate dehydrogenase/oxidase n=1 Tax=Flavobacterium agricola TaxID=2870839 RepID=A0ABY6M3V9_9FLAO|nr:glycerol-3-phosphate dehydrogenase/oxidase [Flavobacterium agricola]UYW02143.1 glycerol-3-phosphate dehydrogenase/oxidase [Flavobacterium agricola]